MIFSLTQPKSQTFRTAQFEAIQLSKSMSNGLTNNKNNIKIDLNNLTKKIYNKGQNLNNVNMMKKMIPQKPTPNPIKPIKQIKPIKPIPTPPVIEPIPSPIIEPPSSPIIEPPSSPIIEPTTHSEYPYNSKKTPKKILVLYVYHIYNNRVKNFIKKCIFNDENVDFVIISNTNNNNNNKNILKNISNKNVKMLFRDNLGYDFGGWSDALLKDNLYENYDNYIFVNSSVVGPFLKPGFKGKWTDLYINGLQDNVKLFGSTINTIGDPLKWAHVQSYIFSMDKTTLKYLIDCSIFSITNYAKTFNSAIYDKEVLMSRKIIENNWNIGSLMKYYENVDFTFNDKKPNDYNTSFLDDVMYPKNRNIIWNEYEILFIKGNRFEI